MASTLIVKIISAAQTFAPLTALLGSSPIRMYSLQLPQGSSFPAVLLQVVSHPRTYVANARLATSWARVQFTIFGSTPGGENARAVETALCSFLDQLNLTATAGLNQYPAQVVNSREFGIAATDPETFQIVVDAMIFSNELL